MSQTFTLVSLLLCCIIGTNSRNRFEAIVILKFAMRYFEEQLVLVCAGTSKFRKSG